MRRKFNGAKHDTEALAVHFVLGRGATYTGRSGTVRNRGLYRRENAGMSSASKVRIFAVESLRFPEEGSSSQG